MYKIFEVLTLSEGGPSIWVRADSKKQVVEKYGSDPGLISIEEVVESNGVYDEDLSKH